MNISEKKISLYFPVETYIIVHFIPLTHFMVKEVIYYLQYLQLYAMYKVHLRVIKTEYIYR